ncbi:MAG: GTPase Era [Coriobacteriia bacterium]|nr:GTPase Era [Coriobacteriia bacterium]
MMESNPKFKSGFVSLVGRPNTGKSSLINALMGKKVAITSNTAQTTRHRFRAIYDEDEAQIIFVDTPGLHKPHDVLGDQLNKSALKALEDTDVCAFCLDASMEFGRGDEWVLKHLAGIDAFKLLVITKADLVDERIIQSQIDKASNALEFDSVCVVSAKEELGIESLIDVLKAALPLGPRWFPEGTTTDQEPEILIAEFIREKILYLTKDEVPHSVGVVVDDMSYSYKKNLSSISATIFVERDSQKGIIIGKQGSLIKQIGIQAREDLEHMLGNKVFLDLRVKVKKDWRRDASQIQRFGYGEGL